MRRQDLEATVGCIVRAKSTERSANVDAVSKRAGEHDRGLRRTLEKAKIHRPIERKNVGDLAETDRDQAF
jgi:hypothetical protein